MRPSDVSAYVPQVWPHHQRRGRNIFFMISRRPLLELSPEDILLYDSIDGRKTVAELEEMYPGAADRLLHWREAAVVELIPPIASPARPHLVVIEPHMDDAALSAGGRLLHRRGRCRTTILSVVKWSNFTSYLHLNRNCLSVREVTDLRQQESAFVARVLGAKHRCLDWADAPLRFWPAERWSLGTVEKFSEVPEAFVKLFPSPREVSLLAGQLMQELITLAPDELWIPMGLGDHVDHRTTRSACLLMLAEARDRFAGVPVVMYEDLPYAYATAAGQAEHIRGALAEFGTRLVRATEDITDVFGEKLRLVSLYASQFKLSFMGPTIRGLAAREGGGAGKLAEVYHRLEGEACLPLESRLSREWFGLAALQTEMRTLLMDRTKCRRLTVIALPSGHLGRWRVDTKSLLAVFPNAEVSVYASEDVAWQAAEGEEDKGERLNLKVVRGGWLGWLGVVGREWFRFGTSTVVLWRGAYGVGLQQKFKLLIKISAKLVNGLIKSLLPFHQVFFAKTLRDFCGLLNEQLRIEQPMVPCEIVKDPAPDRTETPVGQRT